MEVEAGSSKKLNICMLLPLRYKPNMLVYPRIKILSYLTHFGHQVSWVVSSEGDRQAQQFIFNGVEVHTMPYHHYFPENSMLAKIFKIPYSFVRRMRFTIKIFSQGRCNLIFVRDNVLDGLTAAYIRRRCKVPFVFELPNPIEQAWAVEIEAKSPRLLHYLIAKINEFFTRQILRRADLILAVSKWLEDDLIKNKGIPASKVMAIPAGVDNRMFSNRDSRRIAEIYHLNNSKVVIYQGTLGKARYLHVLLQAFARVKKERQNVKLLVVGDGTDAENLKKLTNELGIKDDTIFTGFVPPSEVPDFIAAADVGISPIPPLHSYKFSSPIKMFEYMAAAKPVVANEEIPEHKEVLEESGGGILVPFTPEAFAGAIIELLDNPQKSVEMGRRGREWVVKNRSFEVLARQVERRYFELMQGRGIDNG